MYEEKMRDMYEEMYNALWEAAVFAASLLEVKEYDMALHRLNIGLDRAEKIFLEKNID